MKKIIALCSVLVALALIVTMFTACGDKTEDETTTTTTTESSVEIGGVTVEVGTESAVIKEDGFVVQTLKYPKDSDVKFDLEYAKEHYEFIDFNDDEDSLLSMILNLKTFKLYYFQKYSQLEKKLSKDNKMVNLLDYIIKQKDKILVKYLGYVCEYQSDNIECLNLDFANRNGIYKGYIATSNKKAKVKIRIYKEI